MLCLDSGTLIVEMVRTIVALDRYNWSYEVSIVPKTALIEITIIVLPKSLVWAKLNCKSISTAISLSAFAGLLSPNSLKSSFQELSEKVVSWEIFHFVASSEVTNFERRPPPKNYPQKKFFSTRIKR